MQVLASLYRDERGLRFLAGQFYCRCLTTNAAEPLALQPTESAYVSSKPWRVMGRASWWGERDEEARRWGDATFDRESFRVSSFDLSLLLYGFNSLSLSLWFDGSGGYARAYVFPPLFFFFFFERDRSSKVPPLFPHVKALRIYRGGNARRGLTLLLLISSRLFRARALPAYE